MSLRNGLFSACVVSVLLGAGILPVRGAEFFPKQDSQFCGGGGICCGSWDDCYTLPTSDYKL